MTSLNTTFSTGKSMLFNIASISVAIIAVVNVYEFYRNNIWKPTVVVDSVDFTKAVANLTINGRKFVLRGDSVFHISYEWGIQFGTVSGDNSKKYNRIELIKKGMVQKIIA